MPTGCGRKGTEKSAHRPVYRGGDGCAGVHGEGVGLLGVSARMQGRMMDAANVATYVRNIIQAWRHLEKLDAPALPIPTLFWIFSINKHKSEDLPEDYWLFRRPQIHGKFSYKASLL